MGAVSIQPAAVSAMNAVGQRSCSDAAPSVGVRRAGSRAELKPRRSTSDVPSGLRRVSSCHFPLCHTEPPCHSERSEESRSSVPRNQLPDPTPFASGLLPYGWREPRWHFGPHQPPTPFFSQSWEKKGAVGPESGRCNPVWLPVFWTRMVRGGCSALECGTARSNGGNRRNGLGQKGRPQGAVPTATLCGTTGIRWAGVR